MIIASLKKQKLSIYECNRCSKSEVRIFVTPKTVFVECVNCGCRGFNVTYEGKESIKLAVLLWNEERELEDVTRRTGKIPS